MQFEGSRRMKFSSSGTEENTMISKRKESKTISFPIQKKLKLSISQKTFPLSSDTKQSSFVKLTVQETPHLTPQLFTGPKWDSANLTCALDTVVASLQHLCKLLAPDSLSMFLSISPWILAIHESNNINTLRDDFLLALNNMNADDFPLGPVQKSLSEVMESLLTSSPSTSFTFNYICDQFNTAYQNNSKMQLLYIPDEYQDFNDIFNVSHLQGFPKQCPFCRNYHPSKSLEVHSTVPVIMISHSAHTEANMLQHQLEASGRQFILRSILYYKNQHFVGSMIQNNQIFWYDGMLNSGNVVELFNVENLLTHQNHQPILLVYSLK